MNKYDELLINIGEILKEKRDEIWWKDFEIGQLKQKLEQAEKTIEELKAKEKVTEESAT